jgi:hypothetical protein
MPSRGRAFVIMPFGHKKAPDGTEVDFDAIYANLLKPAVESAGLQAHRADAERRGGSIHADMFQELLLAEFVVADLTLDNPNVWYEIGVRHALRASGAVFNYALRDRLPFDVAGQRMHRYKLVNGKLDERQLASECRVLAEMISATLGDRRHPSTGRSCLGTLSAAASRGFTGPPVTRFDRLARSTRDLLNTLAAITGK